MGYGTFDSRAYRSYSSSHLDGRTTEQVFSSSKIDPLFDPLLIFGKRESRDSVTNPNSTPIIIAADVTGSMGFIIDNLIRDSVPKTFEEILRRAALPTMTMVTDPHLIGNGDWGMLFVINLLSKSHSSSQISRLSSKSRISGLKEAEGGNNTESYDLAWYYAATHTSIDSFEKHGRKGYLFTIGDEEAPHGLTSNQIMKFIGDESESYSPQELLAMAQEMYHVRHIIAEEGSHCRQGNLPKARDSWFKLMGQTVIHMPDHTKLAELIISAIQVNEGMPVDEVAATWDSSTAASIKASLSAV